MVDTKQKLGRRGMMSLLWEVFNGETVDPDDLANAMWEVEGEQGKLVDGYMLSFDYYDYSSMWTLDGEGDPKSLFIEVWGVRENAADDGFENERTSLGRFRIDVEEVE